jgi:hypothetical protein
MLGIYLIDAWHLLNLRYTKNKSRVNWKGFSKIVWAPRILTTKTRSCFVTFVTLFLGRHWSLKRETSSLWKPVGQLSSE